MGGSRVAREVADACAWLDHEATREVLRLLYAGDRDAVLRRLAAVAPDLDPEVAASDAFFEDLALELELRVAPVDDDDQDDLQTRELPDYARFARPPVDPPAE